MLREAIAALLLAATPCLAQPAVWTAATEYPANVMPGEGLATFASLVSALTGGKLAVQPQYDGPDGLRSASIPAAVQAGRLTVGDAFSGALGGLAPVLQLSTLPFVATDAAGARQLADTTRPDYATAFDRLGQHLLYLTPWPASGIWSRHPIPDGEGLKGLRIRTYDSTSTAVFAQAGAAAEAISFADVAQRLEAGNLDAVLSSGDGGAGRKLWDRLPCFTIIGYAMPVSFTTVNAAAYAALDPTLRAEVDEAATRTEAAQWKLLQTRDAANRAAMAAHGMTIAEASPSLMAALRLGARDVVQDDQARLAAGTPAQPPR